MLWAWTTATKKMVFHIVHRTTAQAAAGQDKQLVSFLG